jgi:hypothetical protein
VMSLRDPITELIARIILNASNSPSHLVDGGSVIRQLLEHVGEPTVTPLGRGVDTQRLQLDDAGGAWGETTEQMPPVRLRCV